MNDPRRQGLAGALCGLGAAALFGLGAPIAKTLLAGAAPLALAGLLYLGAGIGLALAGPLRAGAREARLRRADVPLLAAIALAGGVVGPVLMLIGLARMSAASGSLLLNLEAPLTMLVAVTCFGEHLDRRGAIAAALILAGAGALSWTPGELRADPLGVLAIAAACAAWALDNNWMGRLSLRDPVAVARAKCLAAGAFTLALAWAAGQGAVRAGVAGRALALGSVSYGASVVLAVYSMRLVGAAREAAYFATAPFAGTIAAVALGDRVGAPQLAAMALMAAGVALMFRERHEHAHAHEAQEHEHAHVHDEHHRHAHDGPFSEPHSHVHRHEALVHLHPHVSDAHHRHGH